MLITVLTLIASFKKKNLQSLSWASFLKNHLSSLSPDSPRTIPATISSSLVAWKQLQLVKFLWNYISSLPLLTLTFTEENIHPLRYNARAFQQRHISESLKQMNTYIVPYKKKLFLQSLKISCENVNCKSTPWINGSFRLCYRDHRIPKNRVCSDLHVVPKYCTYLRPLRNFPWIKLIWAEKFYRPRENEKEPGPWLLHSW